jgi:serine/threonine-protein kinase
VPGNWQLLPPDANWHSYRFVSPTGEAWLALYAKPADDHSISAHMRWVRSVKGERITYERHGQSWIVVSGVKGDRIFYRKAMLACGNRRWHHLAFEYPAAEKRAFDQFVTQASRALRIYQRMGCGDENR